MESRVLGPDFRLELPRPEESQPGDIWDLVDVAIHHMKDKANVARDKVWHSKLSSASFRDELARFLVEWYRAVEESSPNGPTTGEANADAEAMTSRSASPTGWWTGDRTQVSAGIDGDGEEENGDLGTVSDFAVANAKNKTPAPSLTAHRALSESSSAWEAPLDLTMSRGSSPAQSEDGSIGTQVDERSQFFHDLFLFAENGAHVHVEPSVGGQKLDLWELSRAVAAQQVPNDMVDWLGVAQRLHLKPTRDGRLAKELQACWHDNLAEFLQVPASAPEPPRECPWFPKSCPRFKGQQKLSWGSTSAAAATSPAPSEDGSIGTQVDERSQFFHDLFLFAENGAHVHVEPSVGGQKLDLWELSRAVAAQQVPNDMVDWLGVAQRLHLKPTRDGRLAKELQACWHDNLAEFLQVPASAPEPPRECPWFPKSCPRFKGQQKLSWGSTSAAAATSPAPSLTAHRALGESSFAWEAPLDLTMSRRSSPAQSEDGIWMPIVRLSRDSPDLHK
ncbi:hypothetical protein E4U19_007834 [Claviceps sp. Clav32 group G5]|nr:hypothetical protein E4U19_007834 [Claviceps sp. Clav32 group G5]